MGSEQRADFEHRFGELKNTGQLPSPSGVGMKILTLTRDENCSLDELAKIIQADPALTGRVIKLATSVLFTATRPVTTVKEAAIRLGLRTLRGVALGFTLVSGNRSGRCEGFDYDRYWTWSLACAIAAQTISSERGRGVPAESFTCGLLVRIGRLALASVHPTRYTEVLHRLARDEGADLAQAEADEFGINSREVGACLLRDWGLPSSFSEAILVADDVVPAALSSSPETTELVRIIRAAGALASVFVSSKSQDKGHWLAAKAACNDMEVSEEDLPALGQTISEKWMEWRGTLGIETTLISLQEREQDWHDTVRKASIEEGEPEPEAVPANGFRILVVDDDPVSLKILTQQLRKAGHRVVTAANGREGLRKALRANPQIVITDWVMPEMDGIELCRDLRRFVSGRNLYVLILTGQEDESHLVEAFEAGADDYVVKPVEFRLLQARIRAGERVVRLQEQLGREKSLLQEQRNDLEILNRKLHEAARSDSLTGLSNRREAMERLEMEWANSSRSGSPFSLIMIDVDHFKQVNDNFGHDVGDAVLRSTAREIEMAVRRCDLCARFGGEEFLVICPNTTSQGVLPLAERIREVIEKNLISERDFRANVTVSLGVASREGDVSSIDVLLRIADEAVYEAKRNGRNRVVQGQPPHTQKRSA